MVRKYWRWCIYMLLAVALAGCSLIKPSGVVINWTVESEQGTAGYNLLRAESASGPYKQVNTTLIPAEGDPVVSHKYTYTDNDVVCGTTYWYKLEEVETSGTKNPIEDKVTEVTACR